jgi:DNA-binding MarR family transcriptional regulator
MLGRLHERPRSADDAVSMSAEPLDAQEQKLLKRLLAPRTPVTRNKVRESAAVVALDRLIARGLVKVLPEAKRRSPRLELTREGRRYAEEVVRRNPERITPQMLYGEILRIADGLEEVRARLAAIQPAPKKVWRNGSFEREMRTALGEIDRRGRYGGLVPIPELRRALAPLGLSREDFDQALLEQERAFSVDLKTAHDPTSIKDADQAVWDEGRGWLYYAVAR